MKRILFAADLCQSCESAFEYLSKMINDTDTIVDLLHSFYLPVSIVAKTEYNEINPVIVSERSNRELKLKKLLENLPSKNRGDVHVAFGLQPSVEISVHSDKKQYDLIVMALRQKYSLLDRMIGTVTAHTISNNKVPILAIPNQAIYKGTNNILFPTEIEHTSELTNEHKGALSWLEKFWLNVKPNNLTLLHISKGPGLDISHLSFLSEHIKFTIHHAEKLEEGVLEIAENQDIKIIGFFRSQKRLWEKVYQTNLTRKLLYKSRFPLLII